jgi:hypothetical protein
MNRLDETGMRPVGTRHHQCNASRSAMARDTVARIEGELYARLEPGAHPADASADACIARLRAVASADRTLRWRR